MSGFTALFQRDLALALRAGGGGIMAVVFFLCVVTLLPFAVGPDLNLLARIGPAILWVGALLSNLLALERMFTADLEDGSLDLITTSPVPLEMAVLAKAAASWVTTGLPLSLAAPMFGLMLNLPSEALGAVMLTLLVGTPGLTLAGAIGAALTVSLRRGGMLMAILVLPLMIPVLIFGVIATSAAVTVTTPFLQPFLVLMALSLGMLALAPFACAAAIRFGLD